MSETFTLKTGSSEIEVKMTFGLLNVLCQTVGDMEGMSLLAMDNDLREAMLVQMLSTRDAKGKIPENGEFVLFNLDATPESVGDLLTWAQGHIFDFFMKAAVRAQAINVKGQAQMDALKP